MFNIKEYLVVCERVTHSPNETKLLCFRKGENQGFAHVKRGSVYPFIFNSQYLVSCEYDFVYTHITFDLKIGGSGVSFVVVVN